MLPIAIRGRCTSIDVSAFFLRRLCGCRDVAAAAAASVAREVSKSLLENVHGTRISARREIEGRHAITGQTIHAGAHHHRGRTIRRKQQRQHSFQLDTHNTHTNRETVSWQRKVL
jgi:hypothetical protein